MKIIKTLLVMVILISLALAKPMSASALEKITLAYAPSLIFAPLYIAIGKGYLKEQGIELELKRFRSGSEAVAFTASGQIAGIAGGLGASNFNSANRGMGVKIVAPMGMAPQKGAPAPVLVRSDLADEIKTLKQLKGKRIAVGGGAGSAGEYMLLLELEKVGLGKDDVTWVSMAFPDMPMAIEKKSVDAGLVPAPFSIVALESGAAKVLVPVCAQGEMVAALSFGEKFMENQPKLAQGMVVALMKATRDLVKAGGYTDEFVDIFLNYYQVSREKMLKIDLYDFDPDLKIQTETLRSMEHIFSKNGRLDYEPPLPIDKLTEPSFRDRAVQQLGPFKR
jgi:NitT/TauT family transport system substrate-binding protein